MDNNKKRPDKIKILLKLINVAVVVVFVATFSLYMLLAVRPKTSATESRKLATFPDFSFSTLFSGKYFNDIIYWYTDAAPNRDDMKKATVLMREKFGVTNTSDIIIVGPDVPGSDSSKDERPSEDEHPSKDDHSDTSVPEESGDTSKDQSKDESSNTSTDTSKPPVDDDEFVSNNILIIGTRACEMFGGTYDAAKEF
ncbi:MAG: DHHW family protein, partial [Clostridia bacterium]